MRTPVEDLTSQLIRIDGTSRLVRLWSDGTALPVVRGGDGEDDPKDPKDDPKDDDPKDDPKDEPVTLTLTQAELEKKINAASAKAKSVSERDFKKWLDTQALSEADKAKVEKETADKERDDAKAEVLTTKVENAALKAALAADVDPKKADRFLRLCDLSDLDKLTTDGKPDTDAIATLIADELKDWPEFAATSTGDTKPKKSGKSGGDHNNSKTDKQWTRADIAKLTPEEFTKHEAEIGAQMRAGTVQ